MVGSCIYEFSERASFRRSYQYNLIYGTQFWGYVYKMEIII
jgi:hypothetical protein